MLTLTREVRFSVPFSPPTAGVLRGSGKVHNAYAGFPAMAEPGMYLRLQITVSGALDEQSQYLVDIKAIDRAVRERGLPLLATAMRDGGAEWSPRVVGQLADALRADFQPACVERLLLWLTPFQLWSCESKELPMVRVSQMFEFSAAHRLHNPSLSDEVNRNLFGKCNNALGHGHNYQVQVTVRSRPGEVLAIETLERTVDESLIRHFDHKHLNLEVEDFRETLASVENIARAAFRRLKPVLPGLASVTVWETPKTWAEFSE